eukprot:Skav206210  [mRNA]  locus=scaffold1844:465441:473682:- [translate_table: standard]
MSQQLQSIKVVPAMHLLHPEGKEVKAEKRRSSVRWSRMGPQEDEALRLSTSQCSSRRSSVAESGLGSLETPAPAIPSEKLWRCSATCGPHCCGAIPKAVLEQEKQDRTLLRL